MPNHEIGSTWRKWDLHVHTPASVVQNYGGQPDEAWDRFIDEVEALPQEFAVLGVNDYLFIDGYRKLIAAKAEGRIANIETLLPVVEFRLAKFAGHDRLLRLNYHIVFSEELDPDIIEHQFLVQLRSGLNVTAEHATIAKEWNAAVTRDSLKDLGKLIRRDMPPDRAAEISETDFILGFNNLNFDETKLVELLENSYIRGRYLTAIGKAEWDQYRWNDHSIADKKNIINSVDIVFTAAPDLPTFQRGHQRLAAEGVKSTLFDCSDAHAYADSPDKDRLGNCLTWVKGDTTLDGLTLAVNDYPERVYVGSRPPLLSEIDRSPARYIQRVRIDKRAGSNPSGRWFESVDLLLNPELVAIIGNRGMGKSALLDSIALAGNAPRASRELSFLRPFQAAKSNLADKFEVILDWHAPGHEEPTPLSSSFNDAQPSRVRHLPQHFIDTICNEEYDQFLEEIERVVFSHVPEEEKLGMESLSDLIKFRMEASSRVASDIRSDIGTLNSQISELESEISPIRRSQIAALLAQKLDELRSIWSKRPTVPSAPQSSDPELDARIKELKIRIGDLSAEKADVEKRTLKARAELESARRILALLDTIERDVSKLSTGHKDDFDRLGLTFDKVVTLTLDRGAVRDMERKLTQDLTKLRLELNENLEDSLSAKLMALESDLKTAEDELSAPMQVFQAAISARQDFRQSIRDVIGSPESRDTIRFLQAELSRMENDAPAELDKVKTSRLKKVKELFGSLSAQIDLLRELYAPVQRFVNEHPPMDESFRVDFAASLAAVDFAEGFFSHVANNRRGSFYGAEQAACRISDLQKDADFSDWDSVSSFLASVDEALHLDRRPGEDNAARLLSEQLRPSVEPADLYDYLYKLEYIQYRHHLTMGGRHLSELSPGEKGALLLVFYLLVDRSNCPLLIDQPEENLDNQSVFRVLVPFIREARRRRQVFLVTHNPNIAVVAGAEQVIFCEMDKAAGYRMSYTTGALENPVINRHVLDVLEGTRPAFESRDETYRVSEDPRRTR